MRDRYNEKPHDAALPDPWPGRLDVLDVEACIKTNRGLPMSTKEGRQQVQMKEGGGGGGDVVGRERPTPGSCGRTRARAKRSAGAEERDTLRIGFGDEGSARVATVGRQLTRGQGLLELVGLVGVRDAEGVEVLGAADLELGHVARLLDLDGPGILPPGGKEEVLDLVDLLRLLSQGRGDSRKDLAFCLGPAHSYCSQESLAELPGMGGEAQMQKQWLSL